MAYWGAGGGGNFSSISGLESCRADILSMVADQESLFIIELPNYRAASMQGFITQ